jgi:hypothetical protein
MNPLGLLTDLVTLTPDRNWEATIKTLLCLRRDSLGIAPITFDIFVHPRRDPGVYHEAAKFLKPMASRFRHALVLLDSEWVGSPPDPRVIRQEVQGGLDRGGWSGRSAVVVAVPEIEAWVWSDSPHVPTTLGWTQGNLLAEIERMSFELGPTGKPKRPKEALEAVLRLTRKPRSSSLYARLAEKVSLDRCTDTAFDEFKAVLRGWFPAQEG